MFESIEKKTKYSKVSQTFFLKAPFKEIKKAMAPSNKLYLRNYR